MPLPPPTGATLPPPKDDMHPPAFVVAPFLVQSSPAFATKFPSTKRWRPCPPLPRTASVTLKSQTPQTPPNDKPTTLQNNPVSDSPQTSDPEDETDLLTEQVEAYFASSDTTYQPRLASVFQLGLRNFVVEISELTTFLRRVVGLEAPLRYELPLVLGLKLSNDAVMLRENSRPKMQASLFVRFVYNTTCRFLDFAFEGRPIQRFWFLETVARMPYFAYSSCLHLYATLGWYRSPTLMNMHHAEELNEAYHLAVMESLGGDKSWIDRFMAFHASLAYYWYLVVLFIISPAESYRFSELIETHAIDTYAEFLEANADTLRSLPVPSVAHEYFNDYLYYFQEFQQSDSLGERPSRRTRPVIESLYDVFENILLDEKEHTRTMTACSKFISENESIYYNGKEVQAQSRGASDIPSSTRRAYWKRWNELHDD